MTNPRKYDDVDWHVDAAVEAGQPEENAATHIGLYLGWLIRRDMYSPEFFADEWVDAVKNRAMSGSDALNAVDDKLVSELMTAEGPAFADWYYAKYLDDFTASFADTSDYATADEPSSQSQIEPLLDTRFREWINAGRPKGSDQSTSEPYVEPAGVLPKTVAVMFPASDTWDDLGPGSREFLEKALPHAREERWVNIEPPPRPHESARLEAMVPREFSVPPMKVSSVRASQWRSSLLNRVLKKHGIKPRDVFVATGLGGRGETSVSVSLYSVPGINADQLWEDVLMLARQPGAKCVEREVSGRLVFWCTRPEFQTASWARDELIASASGQDEATLTRLIGGLP